MFTNKKRGGINTFVCVTETPKASLKDHELPLPIILFGIVAYGSVWTNFVETEGKVSNETVVLRRWEV